MADEQDRRRADKTTYVLRQGGFQPPVHPMREKNITMLCNGCSEPIDPGDALRKLTIGGVFDVQLHEVCYSAWLNFDPSSRAF
jgi:hypothetical protein